MYPLLQELKTLEGVVSTYPFGQYHHVVVEKAVSFDGIESRLRAGGYPDLEVKPGTVTIEDCFMELMRK